jgi:hypothetical protein
MPILCDAEAFFNTKTGGIDCVSTGTQCCHEPIVIYAKRTTIAHDDSLVELTRAYNDLMRPYLEPRSDGRVLRAVDLGDDTVIFAWATCHGPDVTRAEVEKVSGPLSNDPAGLRKALGLD